MSATIPVEEALRLFSQLIDVQGRRAGDVRQELFAFRSDVVAQIAQMRSEVSARFDRMDEKLKEVCDKGGAEHSGFQADITDLKEWRLRREERETGQRIERRRFAKAGEAVLQFFGKDAIMKVAVGLLSLNMLGGWVEKGAAAFARESAPRATISIPEPQRLPTP